ncbi:MAG: UDP-N-acetylmuramate--L-alanine ligase [Clostridia bacterium]|nr:UDP-N-acetylmuramate--L-alanine ligase [Clostridia bacterium]
MNLKNVLQGNRIHFLGIGGISMSSLAKFLHSRNYIVSGSDIAVNEQITHLESMGVLVQIGHQLCLPEGVQTVVYTDAISKDNSELTEAKNRGIPCVSRMQLLNAVAKEFNAVIAVAGSHGKTSATAMCSHILYASGLPFTAHIGGSDELLDNFYTCGQQVFVTEACEYKKNLLALSEVRIAVWLNCDRDHLECYHNFDELKQTFYRYALSAERSVVNGDDENVLLPENATTFGIRNRNCDYVAVSVKESGERYAFTVLERGKKLCRIRLQAVGAFHIYNALASVAAMRCLDLDVKSIVKGLHSFTGVKRRFEKIGAYASAEFFCDYAHHPAEIEKVLELAKRRKKGNLFIIFQPHTYSRTKFLMDEFVKALSKAHHLIIYKTYPAREAYQREGSAYELHKKCENSLYAESTRELEIFIKKSVKGGDTVLFLGAGDIYYLAKQLLLKLGGEGKRPRQKTTGIPFDVRE